MSKTMESTTLRVLRRVAIISALRMRALQMRALLTSALLTSALLMSALSTPGWAQNQPPDDATIKRAERHYKIALNYQSLGEYHKAAREYLKAYELYPDPEFFYNVAQVYRIAGDYQQALQYYRRYVDNDPNGRRVTQSKEHIRELTREMAAQQGAAAAPPPIEEQQGVASSPPPLDPRPMSEDAPTAQQRRAGKAPSSAEPDPTAGSGKLGTSTGVEAEAAEADEVARNPEADTDPTDKANPTSSAGASENRRVVESVPPSEQSQTMLVTAIATIGAGAVATGFGVKYGLDARRYSAQISNTTVWNEDNLDAFDLGERAEQKMFVATGIGLAAIATGTALWLWSHVAAVENPAVVVGPMVSPGTVGFGIAGRL